MYSVTRTAMQTEVDDDDNDDVNATWNSSTNENSLLTCELLTPSEVQMFISIWSTPILQSILRAFVAGFNERILCVSNSWNAATKKHVELV